MVVRDSVSPRFGVEVAQRNCFYQLALDIIAGYSCHAGKGGKYVLETAERYTASIDWGRGIPLKRLADRSTVVSRLPAGDRRIISAFSDIIGNDAALCWDYPSRWQTSMLLMVFEQLHTTP